MTSVDTGRGISRRRFLQGSIVAVSAAMVIGPRSTTAATPPPQPPTTITGVLEATPLGYSAGGDPRDLLRLAAARNTAPGAFASAVDADAGADLTMFAGALDNVWPYATLFGNQTEEKRQAAAAWAVGLTDDLPDLGPYRTDLPELQQPSANKPESQRDLAWGEVLRTIFALSAAIATAAQAPPSEPDPGDGPPATAPETTTQEP